jgi:hypothetical protein
VELKLSRAEIPSVKAGKCLSRARKNYKHKNSGPCDLILLARNEQIPDNCNI